MWNVDATIHMAIIIPSQMDRLVKRLVKRLVQPRLTICSHFFWGSKKLMKQSCMADLCFRICFWITHWITCRSSKENSKTDAKGIYSSHARLNMIPTFHATLQDWRVSSCTVCQPWRTQSTPEVWPSPWKKDHFFKRKVVFRSSFFQGLD